MMTSETHLAEEPDDERTFVVDRSAGGEEEAGEDEADHTVVVKRSRKADAAKHEAAAADATEDEADATDAEAEHTLVVKRSRKADDADAASDGEDHTIVVGRKASKPTLARTPATKRRRGIAQPPVPEGFGPRAIDAIGPNAEVVVAPRAIPDLPAAPAQVIEGPAATRAAAPFMPSVLRRGQRTARIAVIAFAAACVVSIVGLTLIVLAVF